ncbi:MAG: hypothetical protein R3223_06215, partial [Longimicrobiales bacterium]|nr:hypothetical protein [Longimicrobiales bacterium]
MSLGDVWTLYRRELRAALRERSIVVNSLLLPVFLYPVVLWLTFSAMTFVQGLAEGFDSRVAVFGVPEEHSRMVDSLRVRDDVVVAGGYPSPDSARSAIGVGELDAVLEVVLPEPDAEGLEGNFAARISFDGSETRSEWARDHLESFIQRYRDAWIEEEASRRGLSETEFGVFRIEGQNVSTGSEMGAFVLSEMVPVFLVLMVALGCFVPAIDSTAGERERGT